LHPLPHRDSLERGPETMKAAERQLRIRQILEAQEFVALESLCKEFASSESSIRRDLDLLEKENFLRRVYGGAIAVEQPLARVPEYGIETGRSEKERIARVAASLVADGQTVILDGGSTVVDVARALAGKSLHIVTNSLPIAAVLESHQNIELTLTGGYLDPRHRVLLGPFCEQMLAGLRADVLIMGIGAITAAGFSNNNTLIVGSEQKMISVASRVIIVADYTKFGRGGMIPVAPLSAASAIVTDSKAPAEDIARLRASGVEVHFA